MIHTKLMVVDGRFVSIGSANFDARSLSINDEANLNALDTAFAGELTRIFQGDLLRAVRVEKGKTPTAKPQEIPIQAAQTPVESQL